MPDLPAARAAKLRAELRAWAAEYFGGGEPALSEPARDQLKRELREIEEKFPELVTPDSPTQRVGAPLSGRLPEVPHRTAKKSLEDIFDETELAEWGARIARLSGKNLTEISFTVEPKIDGINATLWYENGHFARALTRGDGAVGEDISHTVRTIETIPMKISEKINLEITGEVFLPSKNFERVNAARAAAGEALFANPRNAAGGILRRLDPAVASQAGLGFFVHTVDGDGLPGAGDQISLFKKVAQLGFPEAPGTAGPISWEKIPSAIKKVEQMRGEFPFEIDGAVVKIADRALQKTLGATAKTVRWAAAWKFAAEETTSVVDKILVQVGRTGALTPVAEFAPVSLAGTSVSRATLHNFDEMNKKDVRVGDTIVVRKAGDIIPEVLRALPGLRPDPAPAKTPVPTACPGCGGPVCRDAGEGKVLRCADPAACVAGRERRLAHFVSRGALDIEALGGKTLDALVEAGLLTEATDLFFLTKSDFLPLPFFQEKKAENLAAAIDRARRTPLHRILTAVSVRLVGEKIALEITRFFWENPAVRAKIVREKSPEKTAPQLGLFHSDATGSDENVENFQTREVISPIDFLRTARGIPAEEIAAAPGIGEKAAENLTKYFAQKSTEIFFEKLTDGGVRFLAPPARSAGGKLSGQSFVLTGTLPNFSRAEARAKIMAAGGRVVETVSAKTTAVIAGADPGSKKSRAEKLGVPVRGPEFFDEI